MRRILVLAALAFCALAAPAYANDAISWGTNALGELGAGYRGAIEVRPVAVVGHEWTSFAGNLEANVGLANGTVETWSINGVGQLGIGNLIDRRNGQPNIVLGGATQVASGDRRGVALLAGGSVVSWGFNRFGELGNGKEGYGTGSLSPAPVVGVTGATQISSEGGTNLALLATGRVMAWGYARFFQLGDGSKTNKPTPFVIPGLEGVTQVSAGQNHSLALLANGTVMSWGQNGAGQLGIGTDTASLTPTLVPGLSNVQSVSAGGGDFSMALLKDGTVETWGSAQRGVLGRPTTETCGRKKVIACAKVPRPLLSLSGASAISAGTEYALALVHGVAVGWGGNTLGQLGDGTLVDKPAPEELVAGVSNINADEDHTFATLLPGVSAPAPLISTTSGPGTLTVAWSERVQPNKGFYLNIRPWAPKRLEWAHTITLPTTAHSYTFTGLGAVPYEVWFRNSIHPAEQVRIITGTPLGLAQHAVRGHGRGARS